MMGDALFWATVWEWGHLLLRWGHFAVGIAWIGTSMHFVWLDASLRHLDLSDTQAPKESWLVHGGGFYQVRKFLVAPERMPPHLHWFKYEAYFTWITGFLLMIVIYYRGAISYLVDPSILQMGPTTAILASLGFLLGGWLIYHILCNSPLAQHTIPLAVVVFGFELLATWGLLHVFSGRAAFLHLGAMLGTIMAGNVFFVIIPNQKFTVRDLIAGEAPDPARGIQAKQRSLHNNYFTLPVLLLMLSAHFPQLYNHSLNWLMAVGVLLVGGCTSHFINERSAGQRGWQVNSLLPAAIVLVVVMIALSASDTRTASVSLAPVSTAEAMGIVQKHCVQCHAVRPKQPGFLVPPAGIVLERAALVRQYADRVYRQAVRTRAMPLGNLTGISEEERQILGRWLRP